MTNRTPAPTVQEQLAAAGLTMRDVGLAGGPKRSKAPKEPLGELRPPPEGLQERIGFFGGRRHKWQWDRKTGSWLSGCGLVSRSEIVESLPDGLHEQQACACLEGVIGDISHE